MKKLQEHINDLVGSNTDTTGIGNIMLNADVEEINSIGNDVRKVLTLKFYACEKDETHPYLKDPKNGNVFRLVFVKYDDFFEFEDFE